ncbi:MAG: hypothetical protein ACUVSB_07815 [Anaerolineae bacterium]
MSICPNCGTLNQAGSTACIQCGKLLEVIPDWLELLLARYGETMPTFEGVSIGRAPSIAPTEPFTTQHTPSEVAQLPTGVELENGELLDEVEKLKRSVKEQLAPAETQPSEETRTSAAPSTAPKEVDDWLAELRALQEKTALDSTPAISSEEHLSEPAQQAAFEASPEKESSPSLGSLAETGPAQRPDIAPEETPVPSIEERLGTLTPPADMAEGVPEESVPEWLRELGLVQPEQPPAPSSDDSSQLSETLGPLPVPEADTTTSSSEEEIPDWLKRLIDISSQVPESSSPSEVAEPAQALVQGEPGTIPAVEPTPEEPLPDWLHELETKQTARLSTVTPPEEEETIPPLPRSEEEPVPAAQQEELPSTVGAEHPTEWLAELEELIEHPSVPQPTPATAEEEEVPDWLRELAAEKPEASLETQTPAVQESPQLEPAELPGWISQLRPAELIAEMPPAETAVAPPEEAAPASEQDMVEMLRARLGIPQVPDVEGAETFREIASEPVGMPLTPVPEEVEPTPRRNVATVIIWVLVFAVILLGIVALSLVLLARIQELLGEAAFQRFLNTPAAAGLLTSLEQFRKPITAIHQGEVVLLSIEYTPATTAEMQPLASIVLHDLLERRARVLTVSLQPEGAPLAQRLLDEMDSTSSYGERTLNLGYLPGEAIGVRSLAHLYHQQLYASPDDVCQSLSECPGWRDIRGIEDITLFITIADSADPVRWWIEQFPVMSSSKPPMLAAVSAAALPTVRPYLISASVAPSRLTGLIGGMITTAAYEVYTGRPGRALNMIAAQSAAHLGLVAVALAGIFAGIRAQTEHH